MRRIVYAGTAFYTGDALAEALLEYARALARHDIADTVFVPGRTMQGQEDTIELLIGPASQIVSEPVELIGSEVEDPAFVAHLAELTANWRRASPRRNRFDGETGSDRRRRPLRLRRPLLRSPPFSAVEVTTPRGTGSSPSPDAPDVH